MYILYLITSGCRWKNVWFQHAIGIMFPIFVAFLLQSSMANAHAFCSSFGYRYYSTRFSSAPAVDYQPVKQNPSDPLGVWFVKRCRLQILRFFPRQRPQKKNVLRFILLWPWWEVMVPLELTWWFFLLSRRDKECGTPSKTKKPNMHICVYLLDMSDPNTTAAAHPTCQTLHGSLPFQT